MIPCRNVIRCVWSGHKRRIMKSTMLLRCPLARRLECGYTNWVAKGAERYRFKLMP
jgi:hypothetical protein